jgi:hypothetical protein
MSGEHHGLGTHMNLQIILTYNLNLNLVIRSGPSGRPPRPLITLVTSDVKTTVPSTWASPHSLPHASALSPPLLLTLPKGAQPFSPSQQNSRLLTRTPCGTVQPDLGPPFPNRRFGTSNPHMTTQTLIMLPIVS